MWPSEYGELKYIEDLLVCGICYEYMETSVITSCSHNYCSLCIRKYLHYKTECPVCFSETFEKDLRKNKVLDEIIAHFSQVKDKLKRCLEIQVLVVKSNKEDSALQIAECVDKEKDNTPIKRQESEVISSPSLTKNSFSPNTTLNRDLSSPSTSGRLTIPLIFTPKSSKRQKVLVPENTKVVMCPVCKVTVSEININKHLDDCLKREAIKDRPKKVNQKRNPLPKLVFSLMKEGEMRKKLKELGLSSQGDRKALETRLQRYIVLYNAECDKLCPRPVSELLKLCEEEENLEKKINKTLPTVNRLQVNRNTEQNVIDNERRKYLEVHKNSFESLINKIKSVDVPKRKSPARRNILNENYQTVDVPCERKVVAENSNSSIEDRGIKGFQNFEYDNYIQDSDSDTSPCPLQTYCSTDPMKFGRDQLSNLNDNIIKNEQTPDRKIRNDRRAFKSPEYSPERNIYTCSNNISSDEETMPVTEASLDNRLHYVLQKKQKLFEREDVTKSMSPTRFSDFKLKNVLKQNKSEDGRRTPVLQSMYDYSSNDSIDCKSNHGHEFLNESIQNLSKLEKENIGSSPEINESRSVRKRNHDTIQNACKAISSAKKKIKTSPNTHFNETEDSNNDESIRKILHADRNEQLRKISRLKTEESNVPTPEGTAVVRKSTRIRTKKTIVSK